MLQLQSRIGDYFELIKPGRDLIKEGELQKISRKGISPRYFILLSDYLLYTTYSGSWSGSDTTSLRVSYQIPLSTLTVKLPPTTHLNTADSEMATELHLTSPIRYVPLKYSNRYLSRLFLIRYKFVLTCNYCNVACFIPIMLQTMWEWVTKRAFLLILPSVSTYYIDSFACEKKKKISIEKLFLLPTPTLFATLRVRHATLQ